MNNYFSSILIIWVFVANGLWYTMKFILKKNGYPVSWFFNHWQDFSHMNALIKKEDNIQNRKKYRIILYSLYVCLVLPFLLIITSLLKWATKKLIRMNKECVNNGIEATRGNCRRFFIYHIPLAPHAHRCAHKLIWKKDI